MSVRRGNHPPTMTEADLRAEDLAAVSESMRTNPRDGFYRWIVEVEIAATWVADGADFTGEKVHDMLARQFPWARGSELRGRVVARPPDDAVAAEQGYESVDAYLRGRK